MILEVIASHLGVCRHNTPRSFLTVFPVSHMGADTLVESFVQSSGHALKTCHMS